MILILEFYRNHCRRPFLQSYSFYFWQHTCSSCSQILSVPDTTSVYAELLLVTCRMAALNVGTSWTSERSFALHSYAAILLHLLTYWPNYWSLDFAKAIKLGWHWFSVFPYLLLVSHANCVWMTDCAFSWSFLASSCSSCGNSSTSLSSCFTAFARTTSMR